MKNETFVVRNGHLFERNQFPTNEKDRRQFRTDFEKDMVQKGTESEKLFYRMSCELLSQGKLPNVTKIHHGTRIQDERRQIDFLMDILFEDESGTVQIQIKSSNCGAVQFKIDHPDSEAYVIVMDQKMTMGTLVSALNDLTKIQIAKISKRRSMLRKSYEPT